MGLSQTRYAPVAPAPRSPNTGPKHRISDARTTFTELTRLRTVFVMDDDLLRHGLIHIVSQSGGIKLIGELRHGDGLVARLQELHPDLLVVGVNTSLSLAALLGELDFAPKVIVVMDDADSSAQAVELIKSGADALVHRRSPSTDLLRAVHRVIDGQTALDPYSADALIAELRAPAAEPVTDHTGSLTRREREVLSLLTEGLDNRTIATRLFIAEATVKFHLHNIMEKFGVHKRAALVSTALRGSHVEYRSMAPRG